MLLLEFGRSFSKEQFNKEQCHMREDGVEMVERCEVAPWMTPFYYCLGGLGVGGLVSFVIGYSFQWVWWIEVCIVFMVILGFTLVCTFVLTHRHYVIDEAFVYEYHFGIVTEKMRIRQVKPKYARFLVWYSISLRRSHEWWGVHFFGVNFLKPADAERVYAVLLGLQQKMDVLGV